MRSLRQVVEVLRQLDLETQNILEKAYRKRVEQKFQAKPPFLTRPGKFAFILMPFVDELEGVFREVIRPTVEAMGFALYRADDFFTSN